MTDQQKYLLLGAVGVGALAYWYFFYGPGLTTTVVATPATGTPASVVPAATGTSVPIPSTVSQFTSGMGPNALAIWNNLVATLPANIIAAQYANIDALVTAGQNGGQPSQGLLNTVYNWFAQYGISNVKS